MFTGNTILKLTTKDYNIDTIKEEDYNNSKKYQEAIFTSFKQLRLEIANEWNKQFKY